MIGSKIKAYLTEHGIKQSYLAEKVGITDAAMSDICNNNRRIETYLYYRICKALDVPMEYFIKDIE